MPVSIQNFRPQNYGAVGKTLHNIGAGRLGRPGPWHAAPERTRPKPLHESSDGRAGWISTTKTTRWAGRVARVHTQGKGIAGTYTFEVAEQKQCEVSAQHRIVNKVGGPAAAASATPAPIPSLNRTVP